MINAKEIGKINGSVVKEALLQSNTSAVSVLSFGAITKSWFVGRGHSKLSIVLGFESLEAYLVDKNYVGVIAGRVANRTKNGFFKLGDVEYQLAKNNYPHHLHGGVIGFGKHNWNLDVDSRNCAVQLTRTSSHLEDGYPGLVDVKVVISLEENTLKYEMQALPDRPTPISLAQHNYYNLEGGGGIWEHTIKSMSTSYTPTDRNLIPNGNIVDLKSYRVKDGKSEWDLKTPKAFNQLDPERYGIDINLVLPLSRNLKTPVASISAKSGIM